MWKHLNNRSNKEIGYLIKHNAYLVAIIECNLVEKTYRGRPRKQFMEQITENEVAGSYNDMEKMAVERNSEEPV